MKTLSIPVSKLVFFKDACKAKFLEYNHKPINSGTSCIFVDIHRRNGKEIDPQALFSLGALFAELSNEQNTSNAEFDVA